MGHFDDCSDWDYETHPESWRVTRRSKRFEKLVRDWPKHFDRYKFDTRPAHRFLFTGMTPAACPEYAGSYRGTAGSRLATYNVEIPSDDKVGTPAGFVAFAISEFEKLCVAVTAAYLADAPTQARNVRLVRLVKLLAKLLEQFLCIHPYANGNGHAGRVMVLVLMLRNGFNPVRWHIDESPAYHAALKAHRRDKPKDLEKLLLLAITGP